TVKYNSAEQQQWVARYNGLANGSDQAFAIDVDGAGNVYVTGQSLGSATSYDYATVKYDASGAEDWVAHYDGPGSPWDSALAIAVDGSGNVYVTGTSFVSRTSSAYATIKYSQSPSGTPTPTPCQVWVDRAPLPYNAGGVFAASDGMFMYAGGGADLAKGIFHNDLLQYDPGNNTWAPLPSSPDYHYHSQAVYFNGKIYNMGGYNENLQVT